MASALARRFETARPYTGGTFTKIGSEEAQTVETFERRIHGTPDSEPHREFSSNQYTERRTFGRDENGELVVKIEKDPKEPVRPVSPVRPLSSMPGSDSSVHLLKPAKPLQPLPTIPRIEIPHSQQNSPYRRSNSSPRYITVDHSPRSLGSMPLSPHSSASSNNSISASSVPLKKVIKKSRMVSLYDGLPLSPYIETVTYEPKYPEDEYYTGNYNTNYPVNARYYRGGGWGTPVRSASASRLTGYQRHVSMADECSVIVDNPLYRD